MRAASLQTKEDQCKQSEDEKRVKRHAESFERVEICALETGTYVDEVRSTEGARCGAK